MDLGTILLPVEVEPGVVRTTPFAVWHPFDVLHAVYHYSAEQFRTSFLGATSVRSVMPSPPCRTTGLPQYKGWGGSFPSVPTGTPRLPSRPTALRDTRRRWSLRIDVSLGDGDDSALLDFWKFWLDKPWSVRHTFLKAQPDNHLATTIPIAWHVDGAEIHRNQEVLVYSWSSLLAAGGEIWHVKFPLLLLQYKYIHNKETRERVQDEITRYIAWAHHVMEKGEIPAVDMYGHKLRKKPVRMCGPYTAAYALIKADGKARREVHKFKRHYNATFICSDCLATQPFKHAPKSLLFSDFSDCAGYLQTMLSHAMYEMFDLVLSAWMLVPGWCLESCFFDMLHVVWIGFGRDIAASCIVDLFTRHEIPGETEAAAYTLLTRDFQDWCKRRGVSKVPWTFTVKSLGIDDKNEYPELASYFKGVHVHLVCSWLADKLTSMAHLDFHSKVRCSLLWSLQQFLRILEAADLILTDAETDDAVRYVRGIP